MVSGADALVVKGSINKAKDLSGEGSVKGARILMSTKSANTIISDVYAVRNDFFNNNKGEIFEMVKGLIQSQEEMQMLLTEIWKEHNLTIFFVTHDLEEALYLGTRLLVVSQYYKNGSDKSKHSGAKIVADYDISSLSQSVEVKGTEKFAQMIREIRKNGFDPSYMQHLKDFNLTHKDSFRTISDDENVEE